MNNSSYISLRRNELLLLHLMDKFFLSNKNFSKHKNKVELFVSSTSIIFLVLDLRFEISYEVSLNPRLKLPFLLILVILYIHQMGKKLLHSIIMELH